MRRGRISLLALAALAACSRYGDEAQPNVDAAAPPSADAGPVAVGEAGVAPVAPIDAGPDEAGELCRPMAPPPPPIDDTLAGRTPIYQTSVNEAVYEFPFAMATTATHLYWLAVLASRGSITEQNKAYNGEGRVRVRRLDKRTGQSEALHTTADSSFTAGALAVSGQHVYSFRRSTTGTTIARLPLSCSTCLEETKTLVASFPVDEAISVGDGRIALRAGGRAYLLTATASLADAPLVDLGPLEGEGIPVFTATSDELFLARSVQPSAITRLPLATPSVTSVVPLDAPGSADRGVHLLTTDTRRVYALRPDLSLAWAPLVNPTAFQTWRELEGSGFAMAADARRIYVATPDAGGVTAYHKQTCTTRRLYAGNVWRVVADESGVYWGEHERAASNTGAIYHLDLSD